MRETASSKERAAQVEKELEGSFSHPYQYTKRNEPVLSSSKKNLTSEATSRSNNSLARVTPHVHQVRRSKDARILSKKTKKSTQRSYLK